MNILLLQHAIGIGTVILLGCLGEILTEKAGHLNLGIPGIMCIGAAGGGYGVAVFAGKVGPLALVLLSLLFAVIFSAAAGLIYSFLTVSLNANQNVTGLTLTTFGIGFMKYFSKQYYDSKIFSENSAAFKNLFKIDSSTRFGSSAFAKLFLSHGILVYLAIIIAVLVFLLLSRTKQGLYLRSIGENPATADAVGINVPLYKYVYILLGSAIAGIGGLYYVMDWSSGTQIAEAPVDEFGWLAVALVIASMWKPLLAIVGSLLFAILKMLPQDLTTLTMSQTKLFEIFPYLLTVVVLIITSVIKNRNNQPPAHLGLPYFREDR